MLSVMLCGASDTDLVRGEFVDVITQFGGDPWHYLSGRILHLNSAHASWEHNSRATVQHADLCVFVIVERYGQLTWGTELREALLAGKPFLVFCLESSYQKYLALTRSITDLSAITSADERQLVVTLRELESERQITVVPFRSGYFRDELRRQLGTLFSLSLSSFEDRNRRGALALILHDPGKLHASDFPTVLGIALDESEDKNIRKAALRALAARRAADEETVLALLSSTEQGVRRAAAQSLAALYPTRPAEPEFIEQCVAVANASDDVGLARRLIPALLDIDLATAVKAVALLDLSEVGARRRLAQALENAEPRIVREGLADEVRALLRRCLEDPGEIGWLSRCKEFERRLTAYSAGGA